MSRRYPEQGAGTGYGPMIHCRPNFSRRYAAWLWILSAGWMLFNAVPIWGAEAEEQRATVGQNGGALFMEAGLTIAQARAQVQLPAWSMPVRTVSLREDLLLGAAHGRTFVIEPEPDLAFTCSINHVERMHERRMTLGGALAEAPDANCAFAVYDDAVAMVLSVPSQQLLYRLQYLGDGAYLVVQIDQKLLPECSGGVPPPPEKELPEQPAADPVHAAVAEKFNVEHHTTNTESGGGGCAAGTPIFDTMIVYTPAARSEAGGHAAIRAEAALAVSETNVAYQNSQIAARARLVYVNEVDYIEGDSNKTDLERLTNTDDGFMEEVHDIRDSRNVRADLVALFHTHGGGRGWCPARESKAFSVSNWAMSASALIHAHETGHNLGSHHDLDNVDNEDGDSCPADEHGYGWRFTGSNEVEYRTVMAYSPGRLIRHFSNPDVDVLGTATGQAGHADNARLHNDRSRYVEDFRTTRYDIYIDFSRECSLSNPCNGTFAWPYNNLTFGISDIASPSVGAAELPNLYIEAGDTPWTGTIDKAMRITACGGTVRIGVP